MKRFIACLLVVYSLLAPSAYALNAENLNVSGTGVVISATRVGQIASITTIHTQGISATNATIAGTLRVATLISATNVSATNLFTGLLQSTGGLTTTGAISSSALIQTSGIVSTSANFDGRGALFQHCVWRGTSPTAIISVPGYNCGTFTRISTGYYGVSFTTSAPNPSYTVVVTAGSISPTFATLDMTINPSNTGYVVKVRDISGTMTDATRVNVMVTK